MRNLDDSRDVVPRFGSPPWFYVGAVSIAGAAVLGVAAFKLVALPHLPEIPMFLVVAAILLAAETWPLVTPVHSGSDTPTVSRAIILAVLLFWGLAVAVVMQAAAVVLVGMARHSPYRVAFNAAQVSLSLSAAHLVLLAGGAHIWPGHPLIPGDKTLLLLLLAGLAYFVINFFLVMCAISVSTRAPLWSAIRARLPFHACVHIVLFATALLVVLAMHKGSSLIVALLAFPLAAVYVSAAKAVQRDHQANHDELTGLLNRKLLAKRSAEALASAGVAGTRAGFLLIDLDRSTGLKQVNDTLGHAVGDRLLQIVAHRLTHSVRPGDVVARLGGDEFAVLLPSVKEAAAAREVASRLRAALAEAVRLEAMTFQVEASVGIAIYPDDASGFDQLMQRADVAMYQAKERHSGIERYTPDADRNSAERLALASDLRTAVMQGEIELHYQPKVCLSDEKTVGMEALARWRHPRLGMLAAADFIGLAAQSHLISELTEQVVDKALGQTARWWASDLPVQVCVNLPARDLHSAHLPVMVGQALDRHGLPPEALRLEINELVLAGKPTQVAVAIAALVKLGVAVSLDDFGTGYSSLAQLTRLGISEVKLDPALVGGLPDCPDLTMTVTSLVRLAQSLGIASIAEGVETSATAAALRTIGCEGAQGWYFAEPLDPMMATEWLTRHARPVRPGRHRGSARTRGTQGADAPTVTAQQDAAAEQTGALPVAGIQLARTLPARTLPAI